MELIKTQLRSAEFNHYAANSIAISENANSPSQIAHVIRRVLYILRLQQSAERLPHLEDLGAKAPGFRLRYDRKTFVTSTVV
jgi:hypothetical protein